MKIIIVVLCMSFILGGCNTTKQIKNNLEMRVYAIRLKPTEDLLISLESFVKDNNISAGWITTCVGSLSAYNIRFANQEKGTIDTGHFEIVSLTGALSKNGNHIHISVSDSIGKTIGGHLLAGCTIYTTAEIIIQSTAKFNFNREKDGTTPWEELQIEKIKK